MIREPSIKKVNECQEHGKALAMKDEIKESKSEKILCQQLELLAERSKKCNDDFLQGITVAMINIYTTLQSQKN